MPARSLPPSMPPWNGATDAASRYQLANDAMGAPAASAYRVLAHVAR
jgi:hypothetical protein